MTPLRGERLNLARISKSSQKTALHAKWVMEALKSGPAKPLLTADLKAAFQKGTIRAKTRKLGK